MRKLKIAIPFTPQTPDWRKAVGIFLIVFCTHCTSLFAQYSSTVMLDSLPVYETSYRSYLQARWKAERKEFVQTTRKKWWYYLPTVGWSLRSPMIHANTGVLAEIDYQRTTTTARLESLDARYDVEYRETLGRIRTEYRKLQVQQQQVGREGTLLAHLYRIRLIHDEASRSQTMAPEEYQRNVYSHEKAISDYQQHVAQLELAILDFWQLCRYNLPDKPLVDVEQYGCIVETDHDAARGLVTVVSEAQPRH